MFAQIHENMVTLEAYIHTCTGSMVLRKMRRIKKNHGFSKADQNDCVDNCIQILNLTNSFSKYTHTTMNDKKI